MLITNHVVSGAIIGAVAPGPRTAFVAGIASHFALDTVPHWGEREKFLQVAVVDGLVGLTTMAVIAAKAPTERRRTVVAGMLGACLPDADKPSELFFGRSPFPLALDDWHKQIQRESPRRMPQEVVLAILGAGVVSRILTRP